MPLVILGLIGLSIAGLLGLLGISTVGDASVSRPFITAAMLGFGLSGSVIFGGLLQRLLGQRWPDEVEQDPR